MWKDLRVMYNWRLTEYFLQTLKAACFVSCSASSLNVDCFLFCCTNLVSYKQTPVSGNGYKWNIKRNLKHMATEKFSMVSKYKIRMKWGNTSLRSRRVNILWSCNSTTSWHEGLNWMFITWDRRLVHCLGSPCSSACLDHLVNFPLDGLKIYTFEKNKNSISFRTFQENRWCLKHKNSTQILLGLQLMLGDDFMTDAII